MRRRPAPELRGRRGLAAWAWDAIWRRARSGNGMWLAAAVVASGLRLIVRMSRREREVVFHSELAPGEQLMIRNTHMRSGTAQLSPSQSDGP